MTLQQIDDVLSAWNSRLDAAAQNLMDLQAEPAYQQLAGLTGTQRMQLTGATATRVEPALGAMVTVFRSLSLLKDTVERASTMRRSLSAFFGGEQKLREIEELLCGKSIHLPPVTVPLEQRTLVSGAQNVESVTPTELLNTMMQAFQSAKDAVVAVDGAWKSLGLALDRTGGRITALRARAAVFGAGDLTDLAAAERSFQEMRANVQSDPLGASTEMDAKIQPVLARLEAVLEAKARLGAEIACELTAARARLEALSNLHQDAIAACDEVRAKIIGCGALPSPLAEETLAGLREWLDRLQKKSAEGMLEPIAFGLKNWKTAAGDSMEKEKAALAANRAPIETRNELRGRLDALKAKARAYGVAEHDRMIELSQQAETLLYTRPMPLDLAVAAIARYEKMMGGAK